MLATVKNRTFLPSLADEFFGKDLFPTLWDYSTTSSMPTVNIIESKDNFIIELAAPGLEKEDFKIDLHNNVLTISSEKEEKSNDSNEKFHRREFNYFSFRRSFTLPNSVNADKIEAAHKNGILSVLIPKKDEAKEKPVRRIEIG